MTRYDADVEEIKCLSREMGLEIETKFILYQRLIYIIVPSVLITTHSGH